MPALVRAGYDSAASSMMAPSLALGLSNVCRVTELGLPPRTGGSSSSSGEIAMALNLEITMLAFFSLESAQEFRVNCREGGGGTYNGVGVGEEIVEV